MPVQGRCQVLSRRYAGNTSKPQQPRLYRSAPFITIHSDKRDPSKFVVQPDRSHKGPRLRVLIDGVSDGTVAASEGDTVTLTGRVIDTQTMRPVEGVSFSWEIEQHDGSPIDTAALAKTATFIRGNGGSQLVIVGIKKEGGGLRGRLVVTNATVVSSQEKGGVEDKEGEEGNLLPFNKQVASSYFGFLVRPTSPEGTEFTGPDEYTTGKEVNGYRVIVTGLDDSKRLKLTEGSNVTLEVKLLKVATGEVLPLTSLSEDAHLGMEVRYATGESAPLSQLANSVMVQGDRGIVQFYDNKELPSAPPLEVRMVVDGEVDVPTSLPDGRRPVTRKPVRLASEYIPVVSLKPGETERQEEPQPKSMKIFPVVDGLNRCGNLALKAGSDVVLMCRLNDTRISREGLVYDWSVQHFSGRSLPPVNLLARSIKWDGNRLHVTGFLDADIRLRGQCRIIQRGGEESSSAYFTIGDPGLGCRPGDPTIIPDTPTDKEPLPDKYRVLIRITGLDKEGQVVADQGDNVTLKCDVLNATTKEQLTGATVDWDFVSSTGEPLYRGHLASHSESTSDNQLILGNLLENRNARGRCKVTLEGRVTLASPFFLIDIQGDPEPPKVGPNPPYGDNRVIVNVVGLHGNRQILVDRIGDNKQLQCQAVVRATSTSLRPGGGVRYGWEWRYTDEDPGLTGDIAVKLKADGDSLEFHGVQAAKGTYGRSTKVRCVVHVPANLVNESLPPEDTLVFGSEFFSIDVQRKPTTLDNKTIVIAGSPEDDIHVKVIGLDNGGKLSARKGDSAIVKCMVSHASNNTAVDTSSPDAQYTVSYSWEFTDATGHSIDSSLFADEITSSTDGGLSLRGLAAPEGGYLPYKIRCVTLLVKREPLPLTTPGVLVAKIYRSQFFPLNTNGKYIDDYFVPDIPGNSISVKVHPLDAASSLKVHPGEDIELWCNATDTTTQAPPTDVAYAWVLYRPAGKPLNLNTHSDNVIHQGPRLLVKRIKSLADNEGEPRVIGRCTVNRGRQAYHSDYFTINIRRPVGPDEDEGDGAILVRVSGVEESSSTAKVTAGASTSFNCTAYFARTHEMVSSPERSWDMRYSPSAESDSELHGSLGHHVEDISEMTNGRLVVKAKEEIPAGGSARLRCLVVHDGKRYTSKFYNLQVTSPGGPEIPPTPQDIIYPKFRVKILGLDKNGQLIVQPGNDASIQAIAYDAETGDEVTDISYRWDLRRGDKNIGDSVQLNDLVTESASTVGNQLRLRGLKPLTGEVTGRCEVSKPGSDQWDSSPSFVIRGTSTDALPKVANETDDRVSVTVKGLNDDGSLVLKTGTKHELNCQATIPDSSDARIESYNWQAFDTSGQAMPLSSLGDAVVSPSEGNLVLTTQNHSDSLTGKGLCRARVHFPQTNETVEFDSVTFGVSISKEGVPEVPPGGPDLPGKRVKVVVKGLTSERALKAKSGDIVTLKCEAVDSETSDPIEDSVRVWELNNYLGQKVSPEQVANQIVRRGGTIRFFHLRPTIHLGATQQIFGRCTVLDPRTNHVYRSPYFHINVLKFRVEDDIPLDDRIDVRVKGVPEGNRLIAEEGTSLELVCRAYDKQNEAYLPASNTKYRFHFMGSVPETHNGVPLSHLADNIETRVLPEGGVKLTLDGVRSGIWLRGRCLLIYQDPALSTTRKEDDLGRLYASRYFLSGISKPGEETEEFPVDPNISIMVDQALANNTISATVGGNITLKCYAIDIRDGSPIHGMQYSWELSTADQLPLMTNRLAEQVVSGSGLSQDGHQLQLIHYRSTGKGTQLRCLATVLKGSVIGDKWQSGEYSSPTYVFENSPVGGNDTGRPIPSDGKYDPKAIQLEVIGLNMENSLSTTEGDDVNLKCQAFDTRSGISLEDTLDFGWSIATGPDGRPIGFSDVADSVQTSGAQLQLLNLKAAPAKTGGLRGQCSLTLTREEMADAELNYPSQKSVTLYSNPFAIYVEPSVSDKGAEEVPDYTNWLIGNKTKNAVLINVSPLKEDQTVSVKPGDDLFLSCAILDTQTQRRIQPAAGKHVLFSWDFYDLSGESPYRVPVNEIAKGGVNIVQLPEGTSRLNMSRLGRPAARPDSQLVGRCVVQLGEQRFQSRDFQLQFQAADVIDTNKLSPSDYWSDDDSVEVVVLGLDTKMEKSVTEDEDLQLTCHARDRATLQQIPSNSVKYGWQLLEPDTDVLTTPPGENVTISGPNLHVQNVKLPEWKYSDQFVLWGWCLVEVSGPSEAAKKPSGRYHSRPFKIRIKPKVDQAYPEGKYEPIPKKIQEVYVKVDGLTKEGELRVNEGDGALLTCRAIGTNTGEDILDSNATFSWDWRNLDGSSTDSSTLAAQMNTLGQQMTLESIKAGKPIKCRCVMIIRPTTDLAWTTTGTHVSDFFFVIVNPKDPYAQDTSTVTDASDSNVTVSVEPSKDTKIRLRNGETLELQVVATNRSDGSAVEPTAFGYEVAYQSGQPSSSAEMARSTSFNMATGQLTLTDVQHPTKPIKMRFSAVLPVQEADIEPDKLKRYWSEYYTVEVKPSKGKERPEWSRTGQPDFDISEKKYTVRIAGVDRKGVVARASGDTVDLVCELYDQQNLKVDMPAKAYAWQLVDRNANPMNPSSLAESVSIEDGYRLKLTNYHASEAQQQGIKGRCLINSPVPVPVGVKILRELPPTQQYRSDYFEFREALVKEPDTTDKKDGDDDWKTTPSTDTSTDAVERELGFRLHVDSPTSSIYKSDSGSEIVLARLQRPFEVNCRAVFDGGLSGREAELRSSLRLVWYYLQPEIPGDVPIPAQLFPVSPPRIETLTIGETDDFRISIESDAYSFRDDVAEFRCVAFLDSGKHVAEKVVLLNKVKEVFGVRILDENSRSRVYAFENTSKVLKCHVEVLATGLQTEPESYRWEMRLSAPNPANQPSPWYEGELGSSELTSQDTWQLPAQRVTGLGTRELRLDQLRLLTPPPGGEDQLEVENVHEFRCTAAYNSTFETTSRPYIMTVRRRPEIEGFQFHQEKPTNMKVVVEEKLPEISYNAIEDFLLTCQPIVTQEGLVSAKWVKCNDESCSAPREITPSGETLFLFGNSTRYTDEGRYRCIASLQLREYGFKLVKTFDILLKRQAAPAIFSSDAITYYANDELSISCTDGDSSPEAEVTWSFQPSGSSPPEGKDPISLGKTYVLERVYVFAIARGLLVPGHSGQYTCRATNAYGTDESTITVTVVESRLRGSLK